MSGTVSAAGQSGIPRHRLPACLQLLLPQPGQIPELCHQAGASDRIWGQTEADPTGHSHLQDTGQRVELGAAHSHPEATVSWKGHGG